VGSNPTSTARGLAPVILGRCWPAVAVHPRRAVNERRAGVRRLGHLERGQDVMHMTRRNRRCLAGAHDVTIPPGSADLC
jgi:hypothetical protein